MFVQAIVALIIHTVRFYNNNTQQSENKRTFPETDVESFLSYAMRLIERIEKSSKRSTLVWKVE